MAQEKIFKDTADFEKQYREACMADLSKKFEDCTQLERYQVLATLIAKKSRNVGIGTHQKGEK